jgi:hypothetical protein
MADYGLKIKRQDIAKNVEDCTPKELAFSSQFPCAKVLQTAKVSASEFTEQEVNFSNFIALPVLVLGFVYDSATEDYAPLEITYDTTKIYLPGIGKDSGSFFYLFVCYA